MATRNKKWLSFEPKLLDFIDDEIREVFGTKTEMAKALKQCFDISGIKTSIAVIMYDLSYGGCASERAIVYGIVFGRWGYNHE